MIVRCSNCQTQFSLDDRQVGPDGAPVRCSVCAYVFRVEPPSGQSPLPWQVRTVDELMFSATDLSTLRGWISEGRLHPDDRISRTGKHWIRLGDMPEFSEAFAGFTDLPLVLSQVGGAVGADGEAAGELGPPPDFAGGGDDADADVGVVERVPQDASHGIDVSGLLDPLPPADPEEEPTIAKPVPAEDDAVVSRSGELPIVHEAPPPPAVPDRSGTRRVHRDDIQPKLSEMEDSGAVRLPEPPPPPPDGVLRAKRAEAITPPELAIEPEFIAEEVAELEEPERGATSMLVAVTEHVKPITTPPSGSSDLTDASDTARPMPKEATMPSPGPAVSVREPAPPRRRTSWPLIAGLGVLCAAALIFGVPPIRERVVGFAASVAGVEKELPKPPAAVASGREAVASGAPEALEDAEASLRKALEGDLTAEHRASSQLVLVEVLATRAVVFQLQAGIEGEGSAATFRSADSAEAAGQVFAGTDVTLADPAAVGRARARLRLAQGRPTDEIASLVPQGEDELGWLVAGAPMWRDPSARVPAGLIAGLGALAEPSVPARLVLALAYARGGDAAGATAVLSAVDQSAAGHPVALLLRAQIEGGGTVQGDGGGTPVSDEGGETPDDGGEVLIADASADGGAASADDGGAAGADDGGAASADGGDTKAGDTKAGGDKPAPMSVDRMIKHGCARVEAGKAKEGLKLLLRAFDRRPSDIDVLVCMGDAHRKLGGFGAALRYYDKALSRAPKYRPALIGAARAATRKAKKDKAVTYYRRLLAVQPGNAEAKSYIAKNGGSKPKPPEENPEPKPKPPPKEDKKEDDKKAEG